MPSTPALPLLETTCSTAFCRLCYLAALATLLMWSGFSLISRMGGKSILTPYDIFALRLATASLVLLPFIGSMPKNAWRDGRLWLLAIMGNLLYYLLVYQGFKFAPAAHGAILLAGMQPLPDQRYRLADCRHADPTACAALAWR